MRHFRFLFSLLLASLLLLPACTGLGQGDGTATPPEPTLDYQDSIVSALGEVVPEKWASLAFAGGGTDLDIKVQVGDSVEAGDLLATVNDIAQQAAVAAAESALSSAQSNLQRLEDLDADEDDIDVAQKAVDAAQAGLDQARASLEDTLLAAPFRGVIVDIYLRDFETAPPAQPVILLADLDSLVIQTTDLSEVDVARIEVHDPATVVFDALPDVTATGEVTRIALNPEAGAGTYYAVTIKLDKIPENLRWGMSAFVEIDTASTAPMAARVTFIYTETSTSPPTTETETPSSGATITSTLTPSRTPRNVVSTATTFNPGGGGGFEPPTPTFSQTPSLTPSRTASNTVAPPTATATTNLTPTRPLPPIPTANHSPTPTNTP